MRKVTCVFILIALFCGAAAAQSPVAAVITGYNFSHSDQGSGYANLNGWFGQFSYTLTDLVSMNFEVDNYYGRFQGSSVNQHSYVVGPQLTFNSAGKVQPFFNVEIGDQRNLSASTVEHAFTAQVSGGVQLKISQLVSLYLSPVEYDLATPNSGAQHSFSSKYALMFSFGQKK